MVFCGVLGLWVRKRGIKSFFWGLCDREGVFCRVLGLWMREGGEKVLGGFVRRRGRSVGFWGCV